MRTVEPKPEDEDSKAVRSLDWKDPPGETLAAVDSLLAAQGLEVVFVNFKDDAYHFRIDKREDIQ